jgi:hypothetical protein
LASKDDQHCAKTSLLGIESVNHSHFAHLVGSDPAPTLGGAVVQGGVTAGMVAANGGPRKLAAVRLRREFQNFTRIRRLVDLNLDQERRS